MKVVFLRNVVPGDKIVEKGKKCLGISLDNKSLALGQLCAIDGVETKLLFIRSKTDKYTPRPFDIVIGKIFYSCNDYYRVDLGSYVGILPNLDRKGVS